jgi:uncharacterized protein (UPF0335 family)
MDGGAVGSNGARRRAAGALPEGPINRVVTNLPQLDAATEERSMSDKTGIPGNRIRSFVERVEQLEAEIQELNEGKKEVFAEAKGEGFDVKILKEIIKLRKKDQEERDEHETLLDVYMRAMDSSEPEEAAKAA